MHCRGVGLGRGPDERDEGKWPTAERRGKMKRRERKGDVEHGLEASRTDVAGHSGSDNASLMKSETQGNLILSLSLCLSVWVRLSLSWSH